MTALKELNGVFLGAQIRIGTYLQGSRSVHALIGLAAVLAKIVIARRIVAAKVALLGGETTGTPVTEQILPWNSRT